MPRLDILRLVFCSTCFSRSRSALVVKPRRKNQFPKRANIAARQCQFFVTIPLLQRVPQMRHWLGLLTRTMLQRVRRFFRWYNEEHRHSGVGLLTPATVHNGRAENILRQRRDALDIAYQRHSERFVRSAPKPPALPSEVWINKPVPLT
jgi:hypothetical protein